MSSNADVKVIDVIGEGWVVCQMQNVQGDIFYMSVETNEVSLHPPGSPPAPPLPQGTSTRASNGMTTPSAPRAHSFVQPAAAYDLEPAAASVEVRPASVRRVVYPSRSSQSTAYPSRSSQSTAYPAQQAVKYLQPVKYAQPIYPYQYGNSDRRLRLPGYEVLCNPDHQILAGYQLEY